LRAAHGTQSIQIRFLPRHVRPPEGLLLPAAGQFTFWQKNTLRGAENGEAPSVTETASRFRGSGTIGAPERARES